MLPEIITKARARLLVRAPFFGSIALGLRWIEAPDIETMATDGRTVWFCRSWCEAQGVEATMGVVAHEVLHVVNKHHLRRGGRDPGLWNIACDLVINRLLTGDRFSLPDEGVFDSTDRFAGLPAEVVYQRLLEEQQRDGGSNASSGEANPGAGGVGPARRWGEVRDLTSPSGAPLGETERRQAEDALDVRIRQAAAAAKRAGRFGGGLRETVEAALDRVDWRDRFRLVFDGTLRSEASWSRPNRRFIPHGLVLPGWRRAGAGRVAFVLDTSGSISARELAIYTGNLLGLIEETGPEEVVLIQCDSAVRDVAYLGPGETVDRIEVVGRGGTRFQPAFDWIAENGPAPTVLVYATDLMAADVPQEPDYPVIWLTPTQGRSMPFGEIVAVQP